MKIALFGGTFNPPHIGHIEICESLLKDEGFDQVWVLVCYRHPFGKRMAPFWDRFKMIKRAVKTLKSSIFPQVRVLDLERRLGGVSYSIRTVRYLLQRFRSHEFTWVIGADNMKGEKPWKDETTFKTLIPLLKVPRGKGSKITDISSQSVRDSIQGGRPFEHDVPSSIYPYLLRKQSCFLNLQKIKKLK